MSDTKHTPGPWIAAGPSYGNASPVFFDAVLTEEADEDGNYVEICRLSESDERDANAALISAAPELLEALELLMDCDCDFSEWEKVRMPKARAAVAKARGQQ